MPSPRNVYQSTMGCVIEIPSHNRYTAPKLINLDLINSTSTGYDTSIPNIEIKLSDTGMKGSKNRRKGMGKKKIRFETFFPYVHFDLE